MSTHLPGLYRANHACGRPVRRGDVQVSDVRSADCRDCLVVAKGHGDWIQKPDR